MFERFTERAQKVLELALREALQLGHNYIGTEHILLGLVRESEGVAARVLSNLDVDPDKVRREGGRRVGGGRSRSRGGGGRGWGGGGQAAQAPPARPVRQEPHGLRRGRQARPRYRQEPGDSEDYADPRQAHQEQPRDYR